MTRTQKRALEAHLQNGLNLLNNRTLPPGIAVEHCADDVDHASQLEARNMHLALERRRADRVKELETALRRLRHADYGQCDQCGGDIGLKRLQANPTALLCVVCQEQCENELGHCA